MRRRSRAALVAVAVAAVLAGGGHFAWRWYTGASFDPAPIRGYYTQLRPPPAETVPADALLAGIAGATDYIRRATLDSGRFVYLVNTDPAVTVPDDYNVLRHAGTVYSLGMAQSVVADDRTLEVMQRSVAYFIGCCVKRLDDADADAVWEPPEVKPSRGPVRYSLGGAGLGLLALTSLEAARPGSVPIDRMNGIAAFGRFLQRFDGSFHGDYVPDEGGKRPLAVLYYPGEMVLGWLSLHELHPDARLLDDSVAALLHLARERARDGYAPADHWALLATEKLFDIARREGLAIPRDALQTHALQICHAMLEENAAPETPQASGALVRLGYVTPTATRLEAMLAALNVLPEGHAIVPHVEAAVHRGIAFLLRAQIQDGPFAGGLPNAITRLPDDGSEAGRRFNQLATQIRIDYVQHALSAMVQYHRWQHADGDGASSRPRF